MKNILLLHGALGSKKQFDLLVIELSKKFQVHTLNFSGHGGLPVDNVDYSIDLFCNDVTEYLNKHKIDNINIFGYSLGGYVALSLAAKYPELVQSIFTLATKFDWSPEQALKETAMLNPDKIELKVPAFAEELQKRHSPADWKIVMQKTAVMMIDLGENPLTERDFIKVKCPVRISVGDRDKMVSMESSLKVSQSFSNSSLLVLPETAHPLELVAMNRLVWELENYFK